MKKLILFVIIINLFGAVNENNSSKTVIGIKKNLIDKVNYFIPDFLKISSETSFFSFKISYDTLTKKTPSASLKVNIKLPEFFIKKVKTKTRRKKSKKATETSSFVFKIRPILRLKKNFLFIETIAEYKKRFLNKAFGIGNKIKYYLNNNFEESLNFIFLRYLKHTHSIQLNITATKKDLPDKHYYLNYSLSNFKTKFISSYGYKTGGETDKKPFIYYHRVYINFRKILFNKKYIFLNITLYILVSKDYNFKPKPAISSSINIKF
jgi:hypothetical protein